MSIARWRYWLHGVRHIQKHRSDCLVRFFFAGPLPGRSWPLFIGRNRAFGPIRCLASWLPCCPLAVLDVRKSAPRTFPTANPDQATLHDHRSAPRLATPFPFASPRAPEQKADVLTRSPVLLRPPRPRPAHPRDRTSPPSSVPPARLHATSPRGDIRELSPILKSP
jgi:hypothetical protein